MPYFPMYALLNEPIEPTVLEQRLTAALGPRLPQIEVIIEQLSVGPVRSLSMQNEHDRVVVELEDDTTVAIDFWDFDTDVYDQDGPSQAMANHKRATALALLRTLIADCGARLAYMSSADNKLVGDPGHHEIASIMAAGLSDPAQLAHGLRSLYFFWLVAMPAHDIALRQRITSVRPDWTELGDDGSQVIVLENHKDLPFFMEMANQND